MVASGSVPARRLSLRWLAPGLALLIGVPAVVVAWTSYRMERAMCFPERRPTSAEPGSLGLSGARQVSISEGEFTLEGWYLPSASRAATLLIHGAGGNRASLASEARALHEAGLGVLLLELPGHGQSSGVISWGEGERASIRAAVTWLAAQPDVDSRRLGGLGFSLGGYMLAQVAADEPRLRAIALAGTPSDLVERLKLTHQRFGFVGLWPAELAFRQAGTDPSLLPALGAVKRVAPRPLLVVTGDRDTLVPPSMAQALYDSAQQPKYLDVIRGAGHGDYSRAAPVAYEARLVEFFQTSLQLHSAESG